MELSRTELKRNELVDFVGGIAERIGRNRSFYASIAVTVLVLIILSVFFLSRYHTMALRADEKLSYAQALLYNGQGDEATRMLDEIISQYGRTPAAPLARLIQAEALSRQQKYQEAENILLPFTRQNKPKHLIPMSVVALAATQENGGKLNEAAATCASFIEKYPEHILTPKVYESLARIHELKNTPLEAKAVYEKIVTLYPGSGWAARAQELLAQLAGSPSK